MKLKKVVYGEQSITDNKLILFHFLINEFNDELYIGTIYNNIWNNIFPEKLLGKI